MFLGTTAVLTDFGNAQCFDTTQPMSAATIRFGVERRPRVFAPPEQVNGKFASFSMPAVDVWSAGACLY
jgi:hypothetical protein